MEDNSLFDFLNSLGTSTVTENETQVEPKETTSYSPNSSYNPYQNSSQSTYDDYSVTPNYTEQQSYNPTYNQVSSDTFDDEPVQKKQVYKMETPTILRDETPVVNLVKTKHKIELQARMKIVIAMFSVIMSLLLFVSVYNFVFASGLKASFANKQSEIAALQASISMLSNEYNDKATRESFDERNQFDEYGNPKDPEYVDITDDNTMSIDLGEFHEEQKIVSELPSNWFDNVCDFLSGLFS